MNRQVKRYISIRGGLGVISEDEKQALVASLGKAVPIGVRNKETRTAPITAKKPRREGTIDPALEIKLRNYQRTGYTSFAKDELKALSDFSAANIKSPNVHLYRGLKNISADPADLFGGKSLRLWKNKFESWAYRHETAMGFAEGDGKTGLGLVMKTKPKRNTIIWDFTNARKAKVYNDLELRGAHHDNNETEVLLLPQCATCTIKDIHAIICGYGCKKLLKRTIEEIAYNKWGVRYGRHSPYDGTGTEKYTKNLAKRMDLKNGGFVGIIDHARKMVTLEDL